MAIALLLDALLGWPDWLYRRIGHPVTWIGALISVLDKRLNGAGHASRAKGTFAALLVITAATVPAIALSGLLPGGIWGVVLTGALAWPLVAARSLHTHVAAVARPLAAGDLPGARHAVSMIVGRDPAQLDTPAIARAGLESLAENASDGVIAPLFWGAVAGLPGIAAYKAINTLDSMIGHRTPRHERFGWAAARIDDVANLIPARLTAGLIMLAAGRPAAIWPIVRRDARHHRSPNAGWPESAMAGALHCRLSGPRTYAEGKTNEPWLNADAPDPDAVKMAQGLRLFTRATALCALALVICAAI
ncbi:adenosylcobinamide-phosphate synthase CbiB [Actibacterium mucosum]|nr:adenosylcobinamide-phosphate synthase CbiB [Actibacterium mucosum]